MNIKSAILALSLVMVPATTFVVACDAPIIKYNRLVDADEKANAKWSNYESQLQRRSDMIPQLVSVVKASAAHEEETLTAVMTARAGATQIKLTGDDFSDPEKVARFQKAQSELKGSLSRLMMVQEKYPDLKANQSFHDLAISIEGTENRLHRAREEYNNAVSDYNTELRHISGQVINPATGNSFKMRQYFKMDEGAGKAPTVDFSKPQTVSGEKK